MASVKFDLATLTVRAQEIAEQVAERERQLKIAQARYLDTVEKRARERFQDPVEVEKFLEGE